MTEDIEYKKELSTLEKCPFCDAEPKYGSLGGDKENWAIWCPDCGIPCCDTGLQGENLNEIINSWNRRVV